MTDQKSLKVSETHDGEISDGPGSAVRRAHAQKRSLLQQMPYNSSKYVDFE
jgi:hypothetical protein